MVKTLKEIEKGLRERYSGATYQKGGYTYAAWEDIVYAANDLFGPLGWSRKFKVYPHEEGNGYACVVEVKVRYLDDDGVLQVFENEAPGFNELSNAPNATDTAYKGSYADGIKKALQPLGDAFGLFIGSEAKAAKAAEKLGSSQQNTGASRSSGQSQSSGDRRPTDKQMFHLTKNGYSAEQVAGMPFDDWKGVLDSIFAGETPAIAPAAKQAAAKTPAKKSERRGAPTTEDGNFDMEPDEIPF